ncbi:hypothetical protein FISHEDRAFT_47894 [Fistulina hepatica ATCC 64428]|uniref:Trafficking protein particle complex subunit 11 domain-containing protein n=1 Tax=Fistulina hepatica ATCC 64428 TaxID=1128425 RepID=A0A0D7A621_9AGAR|nr:hypothetical protein FISHEDRAFT_47894 [Fistulina hepatica ATCC 64428]
MNSYPVELLVQLAPVMFVAGLDVPPSPSPDSKDPFITLVLRLRETLLSQLKPSIWQPPPDTSKGQKFQILLVPTDVRFPPRKLVGPDDPQYASSHSPLSPLTPTSPVFPDGLIAPIWIRKHTTLVPSVFVLFKRMYESARNTSPDPTAFEQERDNRDEERRKDTGLAQEIAQRKRTTSERGIKLTVVLIASRRMLDDPTLDGRLTFIRRQSGLDSRAALFVLSPVNPSELHEFVQSLQAALYEPALEYYTNHSKRVRRKRNRHASSQATLPVTPIGSMPVRPLRPEGWAVRYEYKLACFAEFRGEHEVALKHYQDAYTTLLTMFGSIVILPPRTKRWAEAKVLADCVNLKIVKLYLYNNEHSLALAHHSNHIQQLGDFSRGWEIGEDTYEYWSWMARQFRVFAELLEQGTRLNLKIPNHYPIAFLNSLARPDPNNPLAHSLGLNPNHALQHPGFYYYMAARCTEMRRERFMVLLETEEQQPGSSGIPGFENEKKVEQLALILELYTKAYELFKRHSGQAQNQPARQTLHIAYCIARTYHASGKFDMAARFFERIAKSYRKEHWGAMLRPLLSLWYECAKLLGDVELSIRLLIEMIGQGSDEDESSLEDDLMAILRASVPSKPDEILTIDVPDMQPILDANIVFWSTKVMIGEPAKFQIALTAPKDLSIASLPFSSLALYVTPSDEAPAVILVHKQSEASGRTPSDVQCFDIGDVKAGEQRQIEVNLRWPLGSSTVLCGSMQSDELAILSVSKAILQMKEGGWTIALPFNFPSSSPADEGKTAQHKWLCSVDPPHFVSPERTMSSSVTVSHRPHDVRVSFKHNAPAYLGEEYPIVVEVTNADYRVLDIVLDILLQPTEEAVNSITVDEETSSGLVKGICCDALSPGAMVSKTLYLLNADVGGDRLLDISIQSRAVWQDSDSLPNEPESTAESDTAASDITETLKTLTVPTVDPLKGTFDISYRRATHTRPALAEMDTFDESYWDDSQGGQALLNFTLENSGPWKVDIASVAFIKEDHEQARFLESSVDDTEDAPLAPEFGIGDQFSAVGRFSLAPADAYYTDGTAIPSPGSVEVVWQKILKDETRGPLATSRFPLPSLRPPRDHLIALLDAPSYAKLHKPTYMTLRVRNNHPSRSANVVVYLEPDAQDGFVIAGLRNGRLPLLLPGGEESLVWSIIPVACGFIRLPRISVVDRRKTFAVDAQGVPDLEIESEGESIHIVDIKLDRRTETLPEAATVEQRLAAAVGAPNGQWAYVLVIP